MRHLVPRFTLLAALALPSIAAADPGLAPPDDDDDDGVGEAAPVLDGPTALETFKASHEAVDKAVDAGASDDALGTLVDNLLDYDYLAHQALGGPKKYAKRCEDRCAEFNDLLSKLIRRNYLKRISAKDNGTVVIIREQVKTRKGVPVAKVDTIVTFIAPDDGRPQTLEVSYVMHQIDGTWQVRDMYTDGLSLAKTWKHDFTELHKRGGMELVIDRLRAKLNEIDDLAKN